MDNTKVYDFSFQDSIDNKDKNNYVMLKAGKGRKNNSLVYIKRLEFSYLEGIIWDKYRGYGTREKTKILSSEWNRIIGGFDEVATKLKGFKDGDDLDRILEFNLINPKNPVEDVLGHTAEIGTLIEEVSGWLKKQVEEEKYIFIMKEYL